LSANWPALLVSLIIGFILGWLLLGISPRRKNKAFEAQIAEMESKTRKTEKDLSDARKQGDAAKATAAATDNTLGEVRKQLTDAQSGLQTLTDEKAAADADLQSRNIEVADLKMQLALLQDQFDKTRVADNSDLNALRGSVEAANAQIAELTTTRDSALADLTALRTSSENALKSLSSKDAALNEAYQRAVNLQRALEDREAALNAAQHELSTLKIDVSALGSIKNELEERLQRARGDVAGEMAVLTSTMIKLKEDQLTTANARITELMRELDASRTAQAAG
jgi:chromosome segregation protein